MNQAPSPPGLSRRLLSWAATRLGTPELPADAADIFDDLARHQGLTAARRWYRRQARAAIVRAARPRRRSRASGRSPGSRARSHGPLPRALALDARLALRMLRRYPGLTVIGGLAIAFAILVGAGLFEFINLTLPGRDLPLPHGDRIVGLRFWDREAGAPATLTASAVRLWDDALSSVQEVGAYRTVTRNLSVDDEAQGPVEVAVMSPAGFRLAGIPPVRGRLFTEADARPGAPPVAVLGYRLWQTAFAADPAVIGRRVVLGDDAATVIGVMPEGFGFPIHHSLWLPLRLDEDRPPGPGLRAFGRLAADADLDRAQAEADALTSRIDWSAEGLDHSPVAQVLSYRESLFDRPVSLLMRAILLQINAFGALFLVLVAANVALLLFARAAARERELAVRTALGATRGRIVLQLFVEALALSLLAAACGLAATAPALHWVAGRMTAMGGGTPPFWFQPGVSPATALYAVVLAVVAAAVAGIMPALKATGRDVTVRLTQGSAGGGGPRFGGIWTAVVITQIAVMVVFADGATLMVRQAWRTASPVPALRAENVLTLRIERDELTAADRPDGALVEQFSRRLAAEPGVAGVTVTSRLPVARPAPTQMALETPARASRDPDSTGAGLIAAGVVAVDRDFFDVFEAPVIAGRGFEAADFAADPRAVVVDRYFVDTVLSGRGAVGRRIRVVDGRRPDQPGPWLQIVGVVETLAPPPPGGSHLDDPARPIVYRPRGAAATTTPVFVALRVPAGVESQRSRLTEIARSVSPAIRLHDVRTLAEAADTEVAFWRLWAQLLVLVSAVALFLSLAGIYAATAFAVSRRTREIGIRVALGASTPRIAATIVRRPVTHVASGVVAGCALVAGMLTAVTDGVTTADGVRLLALGAGLVVVCTAACLGPMRRALRVQPTDALGSDT